MRRHTMLGLFVACTALVACPNFDAVCTDPSCVDGSVPDVADAGGDAGCDPKVANCIDASKGVFVATSGSDGNDGSQQNPLKTIGAALVKAKALSKARIYICAGTYAENVDIKDAIDLLGGFACTDWTYASTNTATIAPTSGLPLRVESTSTTINDLKFLAAGGAASGDSSVAAFVSSSTLNLVRTTLTAGPGKDGAPGTLVPLTYPSPLTDLEGNTATDGSGAPARSFMCPGGGGTTTGGKGGDGSGGDGDPGLPSNGMGSKGLGGAQSIACTTGGDGAVGGGGPNASSPTTLGALGATGWVATPKADGTVGGAGQGGGGGGGRTFNAVSGGGGSGGAGGCGGAGGGGGAAGGGSIALLALDSSITLVSSSLMTQGAGNGGLGVAGQVGQATSGIHGNGFGAGCAGGSGGFGANGGAGAGGVGGVSVAVLWKGSAAPTIDSATQAAITVAAKGGTKGAGGVAGTNDGIDGVAQAVLQSP